MKNTENLKKYAEVVMKKGLNIVEGDKVSIKISIDAREFAKMLAEAAYDLGAHIVKVDWNDDDIGRLGYERTPIECLKIVPQHLIDKQRYMVDNKFKFLSVIANDPNSLKGVDPEKLNASMIARSKAFKETSDLIMANNNSWCVIGASVPKWADMVFPDDEDAVEKLWEKIFEVSRIASGDPIANWDEHIATMKKHSKILNEAKLQELHYTSEKGTDLHVKLPKGYIFTGGDEINKDGENFVANIPTEEVFSLPHRMGVDGIVYATKPLSYNGNVIDNFWFKFEEGKVVDFGAEEGYEILKDMLDMDEGAKRLGEVALVPYHSPISMTNILFYETLYDENASCHFALGAAYPTCLEGNEDMSEEELLEAGVNDSLIHVDFMVGDATTSIVGIKEDGTEMQIFKDGDFVI